MSRCEQSRPPGSGEAALPDAGWCDPVTVGVGRFDPVIVRGLVGVLGDDPGLHVIGSGLSQSGLAPAVVPMAPRVAIVDEASESTVSDRLRELKVATALVVLAQDPTPVYGMALFAVGANLANSPGAFDPHGLSRWRLDRLARRRSRLQRDRRRRADAEVRATHRSEDPRARLMDASGEVLSARAVLVAALALGRPVRRVGDVSRYAARTPTSGV